jgi:hypothetical protein
MIDINNEFKRGHKKVYRNCQSFPWLRKFTNDARGQTEGASVAFVNFEQILINLADQLPVGAYLCPLINVTLSV